MEQIKKGYKKTEVGVIPEDWKVCEFKDLADKSIRWSITGGPFGSNLKTSDYTNEGVQIIQLQNIGDGVFHDDSVIFTSEEKANELRSCNIFPNDIIISKMGDPVARACFVPNKAQRFIMASDGIRLVVDESKFNKYFVFSYINSKYFRNKAIEVSTGSTRQRIGLPKLKAINLVQPTLTEQKAIATALSDVDELITKLEKLIEKKKAIKQGAMQQLLTPPHKGGKRLAGFTGEWVETTLGESIKLQGGYAFSSNSFVNNGTPILRISNIQDNLIDLNEVVFSKELTIPKDFIVTKGDVLIAMSGATTGKIGIYKFNYNSFINQRVGKFRVKDNKLIDLNFISHLVRSKKFQIELTKQIAQGAQPNISGNQIESIVLPIPKDINEQIEIGKILSDIDNSIQYLEFKREKQVEIKQGMMQELLTGKTRLV